MAALAGSWSGGGNQLRVMIQILLDAGANINAPASQIYTSVLQAAAKESNLEVAKLLLARGADINARDPRFGTALSTAARRGMVDLMKELVRSGADIDLGCEEYGLVKKVVERVVSY